ncbi:MAG TPA: hypothetical protein VJC09_01055 [Candidatus Saccharimonadales bacterium]|nr:hypothetical protein [Candidatus Saccharimonadales bacterium]
MAIIRKSELPATAECAFSKQCVNGESGGCEAISIEFDGTDMFIPASKAGLRPEKIRSFFRRNYDEGDRDDTRVRLCEGAAASAEVQAKLQSVAPDLFVNDPSTLAALREVDAIATGAFDDIDAVTTDLGMAMFDRVTSTDRQIFPTDHKLGVVDGSLTVVPIYGESQ